MKTKTLFKSFILPTLLIGFTACDKKDDKRTSSVLTIKVDNLDMVENIKDPNGDDFFPNGLIDGSHVRICLFIYDNIENLHYEETKFVKDFSVVPTFTPKIEPGNYTLIVAVDIVDLKDGNVDFECWNIEDKHSLSEIKITDLGYTGYHYKMLGIYKNTFVAGENENDIITAKPEAAGALITTFFRNVTPGQVVYIYFMSDKANNYYQVSGNRSTFSDEGWESLIETQAGYNGYFETHFFLPGNDITIAWGSFDYNQDIISAGKNTFNVNPGVHRLVSFDLSQSYRSAPELYAGTQACIQSLNVKTFKSISGKETFKQKIKF